ncbi:cytochrome P450 [Haloarchaeobius iranensis]|uniref:Cytochrome P450 n=1 Tax=Haloarchaeobius iranensis TaxID=996166 RepID=A0A1G9XZI4_9EURY|nr:cytochrome P450 [Haloarchaeobius iranensis]SDN02208.1 Cytochrome P450 [Haloarchaeobius iranensis]
MSGQSTHHEPRPAETADTDDGGFPPGPDGLPVLGNTLQFTSDPAAFYDELASYGDVVGYSVARQRMTTVLHPDLVEQVLVTESDSFGKWDLSDFGNQFAPEGLLLTEGEQWREQRTQAQPAFQLDRIRSYGDAMAGYARDMVEEFDDGETVAANERFSELTLRILADSLLDLDVDGSEAGAAITRAARALNERADPDGLSTFVPTWVPTPSNRRYKRAMGEFEATVDRLIAERRDADADEHDDLLAMLMQAGDGGDGMSDTELRDTMLTFLFAGHETTSLALTYTTYLLAEHPDVADRLRAEVDEAVDGDRPDTFDVFGLELLDRVCSESMRLYPPAYVIFREAREDVELGGYEIPADTKLTLPQFRIHRDGRWYDAPDEFRPERWTDRFEESLPEYAYFPFGGGPRHCIGMRFAMLELKLVLATLVRHCRFEYVADEPPQPRFAASYQPEDDVRLRVTKR